MMNFGGFTIEKHKQLWCEAPCPVTMLDNILVHEQEDVLWTSCKVCKASMNLW